MDYILDADVLDAIKQSATEGTVRWGKETKCIDDHQFCQRNGIATYRIAKTLNMEVNKTRRLLNRIVKSGLLCKSKNNRGSQCLWWPVGYLEELKLIAVKETK